MWLKWGSLVVHQIGALYVSTTLHFYAWYYVPFLEVVSNVTTLQKCFPMSVLQ